jgi:CDP-6-deoxy-D-xylo-4-hexulose-3-dehydrase
LTAGRFNDIFERNFAAYLNVGHALAVNSGSSANLLALSAMTSDQLGERRLRRGDEVITVAACFPTTIAPIVMNGLVPVFVDCEINTCNIDVTQIQEAITPRTKAIMIAHTLGCPFDLAAILKICDEHKLWLLEDACDALGAKYQEKYVGTIGHVGTFSFYPAHHITMGEGGAVVTNNDQLYNLMRSLRDWGRDCKCPPGRDNLCHRRFQNLFSALPYGYDHKYVYSHLGYNFKITDWQAAIGVAQLKKLDQLAEKRKNNAIFLAHKLADLQRYFILPQDKQTESAWFGFLISIRSGAKFHKQELVEYLEKNGIGSRQLFAGNILRHPAIIASDIDLKIGASELINARNLTEEHFLRLPNTDFIMKNTFWVGCFPVLGEEELSRTSRVIHEFIGEKVE